MIDHRCFIFLYDINEEQITEELPSKGEAEEENYKEMS